ncbi:MAG: hypothetical protein KatS3mg102_0655 [Planctomycetota bacterium]|nr:MAG: hypothetical protein KatS3mg102_0655 [Planctomycetota bacterium]
MAQGEQERPEPEPRPGAAGVPPADAGGAPKVRPPKRPPGLVRWSMVAILIVAPLLVLLVFKDALAARAAKQAVRALGLELELERAEVEPFGGRVTLHGLVARDPARGGDEVFSAALASADLSLGELLRGRLVIDELRLSKPRGRVVRQPDGSITIGEQPPAEPPPVIEGPGGEPMPRPEGMSWEQWRRKAEEIARRRDMVDALRKVLETIRDKIAERRQQREQERQRREAGRRHPSGRAPYVRERHPLLVVRRVVCDGVELEIRDRAAEGAEPVHLVDGRLVLENLSTNPFVYEPPVGWLLEGKLGEAAQALLRLQGRAEVSWERLRSAAEFAAANLPLALLDPYLRDTLPIRFQGRSRLSALVPMSFEDFEIDWRPDLMLQDLDVAPRDPSQQKIAGLPADKLVQALREVEELRLADIRVHGPLHAPRVEIGDTLEQLVTQGARAFVERQARERAGEAAARIEAVLSGQSEKLAERLGGTEAARGLVDTGRGLLEGAAGALLPAAGPSAPAAQPGAPAAQPPTAPASVTDKAREAFEGLFGGRKK